MSQNIEVSELHWMLGALQNIEAGLVIVDRERRIKVWNAFMEHHSGVSPSQAHGQQLFELMPDLPRRWLEHKLDTVLTLNTAVYSTWEQRAHLFRFRAIRPVTGQCDWMFQNVTMAPLRSVDGSCDHVAITIYDVTEQAQGQIGLAKANEELAEISRTDGLTGLYNRGFWEQQLYREFRRFQRYGADASLVMLDIDHFKSVNDQYGHPTGDQVIRHLADTLRESVRDTDIVGRYGGEEFAIILSDTDILGAVKFCERVRQTIEQSIVEDGDTRLQFTISLGVARLEAHLETPSQWLSHADQALYFSKKNGRNKVSRFDMIKS